ncbi:hypothetical protein Taro_033224, partial [Colocasia esculenta]|nr:hypothetical protein [Colocasia esculenta]
CFIAVDRHWLTSGFQNHVVAGKLDLSTGDLLLSTSNLYLSTGILQLSTPIASITFPVACLFWIGTNIYCKGSVDTPRTGVDTMLQALSQNMKKWSTSVYTRPGQVDTRNRSQRNKSTNFYLRSTPNAVRSTLESLPRRPVFQLATAGRHYSISGRH